MILPKEVIENLLEKKILIITDKDFTYKGYIISYGEDYLQFKDKYEVVRLISLESIKIIEEVKE